MKVAKKSSRKRSTITLPADTYATIDQLRGNTSRSTYVQRLIEENQRQNARQEWLAQGRAQYTKKVCEETLKINGEFPIHEG